MNKLSDNEILNKITEKREQWDRKNTEQLYKLQAKREGYYEAITDVRQIVIDKELEKDKEKKDIDELYNAYVQSMKDNDKYINTIRLIAKTFIDEIDSDKYYEKYNNMTEEDLIDYFVKEVEKSEEEKKELLRLLYINNLSQYGKRKLEGYIKKLQSDIDLKDKVIDLAIKIIDNYENQLNISNFKNKEEIKEFLFEKVEEENE